MRQITEKYCSGCKNTLPVSSFGTFHLKGWHYRKSRCKDCVAKEARQLRGVSNDKSIERRTHCKNCNRPLDKGRRLWCSASCQSMAWDKAHPDRNKERFRKYQNSEKGKVVQNTREKSERRKEYKKKYMKTSTGKTLGNTRYQRRRAKSKKVTHTFTPSDWRNALTFFDNRCAYCGSPLDKAHQEHFTPLSKGGSYTKNNIVPSCANCNQKKRNLAPLDWLVTQVHGLVAYVRVRQYLESL